MGISRRAYAAHRKARGLLGGSHTAVNKAIETGRISVEADGSILPERADAEWVNGTDASMQRNAESLQEGIQRARDTPEPLKPVPVSALDAVRATAAESGGDGGGEGVAGGVTYNQAKTADMALRVQRMRINIQRLKVEQVERVKAEAMVLALARELRDHIQQLPAKHAAMMASDLGCDAHAMEIALDTLLRDTLAIVTGTNIDLTSASF